MPPALRALASRNYRIYFAGQLVSLAGTWMQQIAMVWLAYRLTGSALVLPTARHEILMESDAIRAQFWAAFDAFVPGERLEAAASAGEQLERGLMQGLVAGGEDGPALGGAAAGP